MGKVDRRCSVGLRGVVHIASGLPGCRYADIPTSASVALAARCIARTAAISASFTGYRRDGGFARAKFADARFGFPLGAADDYPTETSTSDVSMCAGEQSPRPAPPKLSAYQSDWRFLMTQVNKASPPRPGQLRPVPDVAPNKQAEKAEPVEVLGRHKNDGQKDHKGAR